MNRTGTSRKRASTTKPEDNLRAYTRMRDFAVTREPSGTSQRSSKTAKAESAALTFVVQKHDARRLHYDFRLELEGTLKSWAIPKGPCLDPKVKRLAVHVEDHPLDYARFEGHIPHGHYGGGDVIVWDRGQWQSVDPDPVAAYHSGKLKFHLLGEKLSGGWTLVRTHLPGSGGKEQWLLIKEADADARPESEYDITVARPESVLTHRELPQKNAQQTEAVKQESAKQIEGTARRGTENMLDGAKAAQLPDFIAPQLATLVDEPPSGDWHYEVKYDGYRLLARFDAKRIRLFTRSGLDWTDKLASLALALGGLGVESTWLDGEIVVFNEEGLPDFQALQNAFEEAQSDNIVYCLFDILFHDGRDLRDVPLEQRRTLLKSLLADNQSALLRYSEDVVAKGGDILRSACSLKLEGVIGKRAGSKYVSRRSPDWIKLKCTQRQEFVIGGYSAPQGARNHFGALLLGVHDDDASLHYVGKVGTGFTESSLKALHAQMGSLARSTSPFKQAPKGRDAAGVVWLEPKLVCEVEFGSWTGEGRLRHAAFRGLRDDKTAPSIIREKARRANEMEKGAQGDEADGEKKSSPSSKGTPKREDLTQVAGVTISHPDRLIDPESGTTKLELAQFYHDISPQILPHLAGRPLSMVRAPDGVAGEQFFQRHGTTLSIPGVRLYGEGDDQLMEVPTLKALIGAVQMGAIEFHTWNADVSHLDRPDRIIFDLDPDPSLPWSRMVEATRLVMTLLEELGLEAFLKTSGGKGMHVVVPLARRHDWAELKEFSKAVAQHMAQLIPNRFTDRMGPQNRVGKIFVDYLRNQKEGTTVCAFSVRARPGLGVSVPIAHDELERIDSAAQWNVGNLAARLSTLRSDPWADYAKDQRITQEMKDRLKTK